MENFKMTLAIFILTSVNMACRSRFQSSVSPQGSQQTAAQTLPQSSLPAQPEQPVNPNSLPETGPSPTSTNNPNQMPSSPQVDTNTSSPSMTEQPLPSVSPLPKSMQGYTPNLSDDQCQSRIPITDPFKDLTMRTKKVCASGCEFTEISDALVKAAPNDEIQIESGLYKGCFTTTVSPIRLVGVNGLVRLDFSQCTTAATLNSESIQFVNFQMLGGTGQSGVLIGTKVKFAQIQGVWIEGTNTAITGSGAPGATVIIKDFKIKDVGTVWGTTNHATGVIGSNADNLIIHRGTFSHHKLNSWAVASNSKNLEFMCNVAMATENESGHSFHLTNNEYVHVEKNFFQYSQSPLAIYHYLNSINGTTIDWKDNVMVFDNTLGYVFNVNRAAKVNFLNNVMIGGKGFYDFQTPIDPLFNKVIPSREAAGYLPFPQIPVQFPIERLE